VIEKKTAPIEPAKEEDLEKTIPVPPSRGNSPPPGAGSVSTLILSQPLFTDLIPPEILNFTNQVNDVDINIFVLLMKLMMCM
jgi:hypothetical protein